jgi:hypothetical protein
LPPLFRRFEPRLSIHKLLFEPSEMGGAQARQRAAVNKCLEPLNPDIDRASESIYGCYECVWDDKIHFTFDGNRIKNIKWDFYLD